MSVSARVQVTISKLRAESSLCFWSVVVNDDAFAQSDSIQASEFWSGNEMALIVRSTCNSSRMQKYPHRTRAWSTTGSRWWRLGFLHGVPLAGARGSRLMLELPMASDWSLVQPHTRHLLVVAVCILIAFITPFRSRFTQAQGHMSSILGFCFIPARFLGILLT
jgi:hypothetical protein